MWLKCIFPLDEVNDSKKWRSLCLEVTSSKSFSYDSVIDGIERKTDSWMFQNALGISLLILRKKWFFLPRDGRKLHALFCHQYSHIFICILIDSLIYISTVRVWWGKKQGWKKGRERKLNVFHCLVEERKMRGLKENRMGIFQTGPPNFSLPIGEKMGENKSECGALKSKDFFAICPFT